MSLWSCSPNILLICWSVLVRLVLTVYRWFQYFYATFTSRMLLSYGGSCQSAGKHKHEEDSGNENARHDNQRSASRVRHEGNSGSVCGSGEPGRYLERIWGEKEVGSNSSNPSSALERFCGGAKLRPRRKAHEAALRATPEYVHRPLQSPPAKREDIDGGWAAEGPCERLGRSQTCLQRRKTGRGGRNPAGLRCSSVGSRVTGDPAPNRTRGSLVCRQRHVRLFRWRTRS